MSIASLLGVLFGFGLFFAAVFLSADDYLGFISAASLLMVVGGTTAAAFMSFQARYVVLSFQAIWWMIKKPRSTRESLNTEILRLIQWSYLVQAKGLPALENEVKNLHTNDRMISYCVELVATGYKPEELAKMVHTSIESEYERKLVPAQILKQMASAAPAFGMIGTLVGLVVMLQGLDGDLAKLGDGLSLALLTTLYGVVFARLVFTPAALKLQQKLEIERFRNYLIAEGLVLLSEKRSPRYMQDRLNSYLDPDIHFDIDKQLNTSKATS